MIVLGFAKKNVQARWISSKLRLGTADKIFNFIQGRI
jgi:hypothetical protein